MSIRRQRVLWIAALAAMLHALLPALHGLYGQESWQTVCSNTGSLTLIDVSAEAGPDSPGPTGQSALAAAQCPLCLAGAHLLLTPRAAAGDPTRPELRHVRPPQPAAGARPSSLLPAPWARGPPVLS